jgi:aminoglycoside 6-adenylyltransferase
MNKLELIKDLSRYLTRFDESQVLILNGSMADPNVSPDQFQDIDLSMLSSNISVTTTRIRGCTLLDAPLLFTETHQKTPFAHAAVRILLASGTEVGFNIYSNKDTFLREINRFIVLLFNKLDEPLDIAPPTHRPFHVDKPHNEEFQNLFTDIYWAITDVMKGVNRGQFIYAKHKYDTILQPKIKTLIVWYTRDLHDWNVSLGSHGKRIKDHVEPGVYKEYLATYSPNNLENFVDTLFNAKRFVSNLGSKLAKSLGYVFPSDIDGRMSAYLQTHTAK